MSLIIDYETPDSWLSSGEQTHVQNQVWKAEIKKEFHANENSLDQLTQIQQWIKTKFTYEPNHGATIGMLTVDQLYASKVWHGCHDLAHIFAATVRLIGYPCILVETTSVVWSKAYAKDNHLDNPSGHNFTEVYVNGKWVLFDPMSPAYLSDYEYNNPHIPVSIYDNEPEGFYVIAKGKDCWDYGIRNLDDLIERQKATAISYFKI